jgi:hypothetical protein
MLGDSTLYGGSYVDQEDLYARRMHAELSAMVPGRTVEVLNMGVNGWGPFHKLGYLERFGAFDADLTLVCLPHGDPRRPLSRLAAVPYFPANAPPYTAMEEVVYHLLWRWRNNTIGPPSIDERNARIERGRVAYRTLVDALAAKDSEVMIEILPSRTAATTPKPGPYERDEVKALRAALMGYSVGFPTGFLAHQKLEKALYHDSVHLDVDGHGYYAGYLSARIRAVSTRWRAFEGARR